MALDWYTVPVAPGLRDVPVVVEWSHAAARWSRRPRGAVSAAPEHVRDLAFEVPEIRAGVQTVRVVNQGPKPHEMMLARVPSDVTPEQIVAAFQGLREPPFPVQNLSGPRALSSGLEGWVTADFAPGTYMLPCSVPDPATGLPHVALGMYAVVTARSAGPGR